MPFVLLLRLLLCSNLKTLDEPFISLTHAPSFPRVLSHDVRRHGPGLKSPPRAEQSVERGGGVLDEAFLQLSSRCSLSLSATHPVRVMSGTTKERQTQSLSLRVTNTFCSPPSPRPFPHSHHFACSFFSSSLVYFKLHVCASVAHDI